MKRKWVSTFCLLLSAVVARAELPKDANVDQVLGALHARGTDLKSVAADVKVSQADAMGDDTTLKGNLVLLRASDGDTKVKITFTEKQRGKRITNDRRDVVLDGVALVDREWTPKKQTTRIVRRPGEKLDLFKLGEGPFPLPIGQPKEDVLKEFDVKPATPETPTAGLTYIELKPKPGSASAKKFAYLIVGVRPDGWPVSIEYSDANQSDVSTVTMTNVRLNDAVKESEFKLEPIGDDWTKIEEQLPS